MILETGGKPLEGDDGDFETEYKKGLMYLHGIGVKQNYIEAYAWLKRSADQGYCRAILSIGFMYLDGVGLVQNAPKAYSRFKFVAKEQKNKRARLLLGLMYEHGVGVEYDYPTSLKYYKKSEEKEYEEHLLWFSEVVKSTSSEDEYDDD